MEEAIKKALSKDKTTMKLTLLGATGSVGRQLLTQALTAGHAVTVLVRQPDTLGDVRARVTVVQGDVTASAAVARAVADADAVLSTLGHRKGSPKDVFAQGITHTIAAMQQQRVRRLVALANTALSDPDDQPTFRQRSLHALMRLAAGQINRDHAAQARLIADSGLDWTIVRAALLANGPPSGQYQVGKLDRSTGSRIMRADVADFMLTCATQDTYRHSMPVISQA
jgi:putative NADH-flavin reductase